MTASGYRDCACRDCFDIAIGSGPSLCNDCAAAGCDVGGEAGCEREDFGEPALCTQCGQDISDGKTCGCGFLAERASAKVTP